MKILAIVVMAVLALGISIATAQAQPSTSTSTNTNHSQAIIRAQKLIESLQKNQTAINQAIEQLKTVENAEKVQLQKQEQQKQAVIKAEQQIAEKRNAFAKYQLEMDKQVMDCLHNASCAPKIKEKFGPWNLPDCYDTGDVGICWNSRLGGIHA